jgi:hypothetical protein
MRSTPIAATDGGMLRLRARRRSILKPILRLTNPVTAWMLRRVARGMRSQVT